MSKKSHAKKNRLPAVVEPLPSGLVKVIVTLSMLILATPLIASFHENLESFYSKVVVAQLLIEALVACWVVLAVQDRQYRPDWRSPMVWGLLAAVGTLLLALPFALDPAYSFWSRPGRMNGVVNSLHYFAWLLVLLSTFKRPTQYRRLLTVSCVVAIAVGLLGFRAWLANPSESVQSTLDNSSFFGAYMMLQALVGSYLLIGADRWRTKLLALLAVFVSVVSVFLSGSRGAVLVLFFSAGAAAFTYFLQSSLSRVRKIAAVSVLTLLAATLVGSFLLLRSDMMRDWVNANLSGPTHRLVTRNFGDDRWVLWRYGLLGAMERPLFGWGMEQYEVPFYKYYDPTGADLEIMNERFADRAHNQYLDVLISSGLVGLVGFLSFLILALYSAWIALRRSTTVIAKRQSVLMGATVIAYCTYGFFMFDTPMAWLLALLCFSLVAAHYRSVDNVVAEALVVASVRTQPKYLLIAPVVAVALAVASFVNFLPLRKVWQVAEAQAMVDTNRTAALEKFESALNGYDPYRYDSRLRMMEKIKKWSENVSLISKPLGDLLAYATPYIADAAKQRDYNARFQIAAAATYRMLGDYDPTALDRAERYAQSVIILHPNRADAYFEQAEIDLARRDSAAAIDNINLALVRVPHKNIEVRRYMNYRLASAHALNCSAEQTKKYFDAAVADGYPHGLDTRLLIDIGQSCGVDQNFSWAANHADSVLVTYPDHPEVLKAAAKIYSSAGMTHKVEVMIERLDRRDPPAAELLANEIQQASQ
ncbi:MAG: O-antigen ligase family protein [Patescibacteria group bacterium]